MAADLDERSLVERQMQAEAEPTTPWVDPALWIDEALAKFKAGLRWSTEATDHEKALVHGNLNGFASALKEQVRTLPDASQGAGGEISIRLRDIEAVLEMAEKPYANGWTDALKQNAKRDLRFLLDLVKTLLASPPAPAQDEALSVLREIEWSYNVRGTPYTPEAGCPSCHSTKLSGHASDCALAAALRRAG